VSGLNDSNESKRDICLSLADINPVDLFGQNDEWLRALRRHTNVRIIARGHELRLIGEAEDVHRLETLFLRLIRRVRDGKRLDSSDYLLPDAIHQESVSNDEPCVDCIVTPRKEIRPRTDGQRHYVQALFSHDVVFAIGPAGTGKTYLAAAVAISALSRHEVRRLILVRPAVEAGEKLGYLPGDLREKVDPYLRPLYDALYDLLPMERAKRLMAMEAIEIVPLAFMRGRTLNDSYVILDEAQNTTPLQMKMFLTRLGNRSRAIVTGDITQIDLADGQISGLIHVRSILESVPGVAFIEMSRGDVVRHPLVQRIVEAYEKLEQE